MKRITTVMASFLLLLTCGSAAADPVAGGNGYGGPSDGRHSNASNWKGTCSRLNDKCAKGLDAACVAAATTKECSDDGNSGSDGSDGSDTTNTDNSDDASNTSDGATPAN